MSIKQRAVPDWSDIKTYAALRAFADRYSRRMTPAERLAMVERMRQVRYGYEAGTLPTMRERNVTLTSYTLEEFRVVTEREYQEELKKYGPR
jgi:hypothetical protein